jgi:hypothetical protein
MHINCVASLEWERFWQPQGTPGVFGNALKGDTAHALFFCGLIFHALKEDKLTFRQYVIVCFPRFLRLHTACAEAWSHGLSNSLRGVQTADPPMNSIEHTDPRAIFHSGNPIFLAYL